MRNLLRVASPVSLDSPYRRRDLHMARKRSATEDERAEVKFEYQDGSGESFVYEGGELMSYAWIDPANLNRADQPAI